jgi:predicted DNA-binding protein (MmcQ/YjbR family)
MPNRNLAKLRKLCLSLPEAYEQETWGEATFRVRKKIFAMASVQGARVSTSMKANREDHQALVAQGDPFFLPSYVGSKGWIGIDLGSARVDWDEVRELVTESYRLIAPKRLSATLDDPSVP